MRIAHLSDLHLLGAEPISFGQLLNKRATGVMNLRFRRHAIHQPAVAATLARELRRYDVDHVVITGDLSNLALASEFAAGRRFLEEELGFPPDRVSVIPGNHDVYTAGSARTKRFAHFFAPYLQSDLPHLAVDHAAGRFPYVHLRGPIAFVGLASAVPRPPLIAAGMLGQAQQDALFHILTHPDLRDRYPVVLIHHPPSNPLSWRRTFTNGLWDARRLQRLLAQVPRALVLHGHLHRRVRNQRSLGVNVIGATSSSLVHDDPARMAGFHLYDVDATGLTAAPRALIWNPTARVFDEQTLTLA